MASDKITVECEATWQRFANLSPLIQGGDRFCPLGRTWADDFKYLKQQVDAGDADAIEIFEAFLVWRLCE